MLSPGVLSQIVDRSFVVSGQGSLTSGIVITSDRGPTSVKLVSNARQFIDQYGLPSRDNPSMYSALRYLNRVGGLYVRRVINNATAADATEDDIVITAENEGTWGNGLVVSFHAVPNSPAGVFEFRVSLNGDIVESFEVSRDQNAKNGFGRSIFVEDVVNARSVFVRVKDIFDGEDSYAEASMALSGGSDDIVAPADGDIVDAWDDFDNTQAFDPLLLINAGFASAPVATKILAIAESRKTSFAILDVPEAAAADVDAMVTYRGDTLGADSYHGAMYGGWLKVYDQYADREVTVPASGDVAAAIIATIQNGERWTAPFGLENGTLPNVVDTTKRMSDAELDVLYSNGINPVTKIGLANAVIWGQKTLQVAASGLDRINVVLSVLWMNESIKTSLLSYVGKSNTALVRESAFSMVDSFLEGILRRGGLYGKYVDISDDINTPDVIDRGEFFIDVYVQPTRAMEFIRQRMIVTGSGVSLG